ncbi:hypothetical protein [Vibrio sp. TBV020]|uniref:hypothetical protein n=1 Tax=Vibrio sp. TBV020 TaxID=3137398 RepID=UPI0038CD2678
MKVEDNNQDHLDIDEDAVFATAVSEMTGELTGEVVNEPTVDPIKSNESELDPLGQGEEDKATSSNEQEPDELEQLKAANARLEHSLNSEKGRTRSALKRWEGAQQKLSQVTQSLAENPEGFLDDDFRENFPELAEELEKSMAKSTERTNQSIKAALDPMQSLVDGELESLQEETQIAAESAVEDAIPDARQILQDPRFNSWLESQPAGVQGLFDSDDPQDAIYLLNQFKSSPSPGSEVQSRREKQKRSLNTAGGRSAVPKDNADVDDEDALWKSISQQVEKDFGHS